MDWRSRRALLLPHRGRRWPFRQKGSDEGVSERGPDRAALALHRPHPTRLRRATFSRRAGRRTRGVVGPAAGWTGALAARSFSRTAGEGGPFVRKGRMRACQKEAPTVPPLPAPPSSDPTASGHLLPSSREKDARRRWTGCRMDWRSRRALLLPHRGRRWPFRQKGSDEGVSGRGPDRAALPAAPSSDLASRGHLLPSNREKETDVSDLHRSSCLCRRPHPISDDTAAIFINAPLCSYSVSHFFEKKVGSCDLRFQTFTGFQSSEI